MRYAPLLAATVVLLLTTVARASPPVPVETAVVETGTGPCGVVAARDGALWVGVYGAGAVLSIDPGRGRVQTRVAVGRWACRVAVGPSALWVTRDRAGEVVRVSRGSGRRRRIQVGRSPFDLLLAMGALWVSSYDIGAIVRLDPRTGALRRVYKDGGLPVGLTACNGRIWVGHGQDVTWLTDIDPATHRMRRVETDARAPAWPRCVRGEIWVTTHDSVLRIDAGTWVVRARIHLGGTPVEAAAAPDGLVWVTDKERSLVFRVDPGTNAVVDSFAAGPGALALARVGSSMWVTSFAGADVRRYDP